MQEIIGKPTMLRRLAAASYDGFLLFAVLFAAAGLYGYIGDLISGASTKVHHNTGDLAHELPPIAEGWLYNCYLLIIICSFYAIFWCKNGQTLGMQAWRIKAQSTNGEIMTIKQALIRVLIGLISFFFGLIGLLWVLIDKDKRSLYDKASNTEVVLLAKPKK